MRLPSFAIEGTLTLLSETQQHYWSDRYALKDAQGENIETDIEQTWNRVASAIADTPSETEAFLGVLRDFKFVPGGRIIAGAGAESQKTFYNCYVIPVETRARRELRELNQWYEEYGEGENLHEEYDIRERQLTDHGADSREAILDTINTMVGIMSRGGGVGINWSVLRPSRSYLTRVSGHSSGPVGWMHVASTAVGEVIQGGSRRGAAMFMLDIWHPDVLAFIEAKKDNTKITNANVSVGVTDAFMDALSRDEDWTFEFPDTTHGSYDSLWDGDIKAWKSRGLPVVSFGTVPARQVWDSISESAHASGEPGVIFLDRYNDLSTANGEERIICVNPCGEQGLGAYSVCNLGAMNLYAYVDEAVYPDTSMGGGFPSGQQISSRIEFDFRRFATDVKTAVRFLDNVIDKTPDYLPEVAERQRRLRRIGLGVMGLADALVALGIRYGSPASVEFVEKVFRCMKDAAIEESALIGAQKGVAEAWTDSMRYRPYLAEYTSRTDVDIIGLRNIFLLTQAPTGTTSLLADVSSGIEPYFNKHMTWRSDRTGGRWIGPRAVQDLWPPVEGGSNYIPDYVVDSSEVTVDEHIAIQAAVQRYVDSSVSKTINAPSDQTVAETSRAFTRAYYAGLKGIAYYRDGSRDQQVLYHANPNDRIRELEARIAELEQAALAPTTYLPNPWAGKTTWSAPAPFIQYLQEGKDGCPECGGEITREEGCMKCHNCGWAAC